MTILDNQNALVPSSVKGGRSGVGTETSLETNPNRYGEVEPGHDLQYNINIAHCSIKAPPLDGSVKLDSKRIAIEPLQLEKVALDDCAHIDHSCLATLLNDYNKLPVAKQLKVNALQNKLNHYPELFAYEGYFTQCSLLAMLEQSVSTTICFCGLKNKKKMSGVNPSGLCNKPRLCHHCARIAGERTLKTFRPNFHKHEWGFLTISYKGSLTLGHTSGEDWWLSWDAARAALKRLVTTNRVGGALLREEIALLTLAPTTVQPHLHAIVPAGELSEGDLGLLARWTTSYCDDLGRSVSLEPSILFKPLPTEEDFARVLRYIYKPIDLVAPYQNRWECAQTTQDKALVNRSMRDAMESIIMLPKGRHAQIDYLGNMRAASKSTFIGVPVKDRKKAKPRSVNNLSVRSISNDDVDPLLDQSGPPQQIKEAMSLVKGNNK